MVDLRAELRQESLGSIHAGVRWQVRHEVLERPEWRGGPGGLGGDQEWRLPQQGQFGKEYRILLPEGVKDQGGRSAVTLAAPSKILPMPLRYLSQALARSSP